MSVKIRVSYQRPQIRRAVNATSRNVTLQKEDRQESDRNKCKDQDFL